MNLQKFLLGNGKNLNKKAYLWTMISGTSYSASTVILTWIVIFLIGAEKAGIFSFAYSNAQVMLNIGFYGVRAYQVTDIRKRHSFDDYWISRIFSYCLMVATSVVYTFINSFSVSESIIIILMCIYKGFDAISDVYEGLYQQNNRMDLAGKSSFFKNVGSTFIFIVILQITKEIVLATIGALCASLIIWTFFDITLKKEFSRDKFKIRFSSVKKLLIACLPLCIGNFLSSYILNAQKYAIQLNMSEIYQTYYTILFMPAFVINLFSGFLFKPMLTTLARFWDSMQIQRFTSTIKKLCVWIAALTVAALIGGYFLGIPVLSIVYGINLSAYKKEFMILLIGGGFGALTVLLTYVATLMRKQKFVFVIYALVSIIAFFVSPILVGRWKLLGAAYGYLLLMLLQAIGFLILWYINTIREYIKLERREIN